MGGVSPVSIRCSAISVCPLSSLFFWNAPTFLLNIVASSRRRCSSVPATNSVISTLSSADSPCPAAATRHRNVSLASGVASPSTFCSSPSVVPL